MKRHTCVQVECCVSQIHAGIPCKIIKLGLGLGLYTQHDQTKQDADSLKA